MLTSLLNLTDFFKSISFSLILTCVKNLILYLYGIAEAMLNDIKANNGLIVMFFAWLLISMLCGFTFTVLAMIIHSCYIHHMQDAVIEVCNHEDIVKYTFVICLGSLIGNIL